MTPVAVPTTTTPSIPRERPVSALVDTSALYELLDRSAPSHADVLAAWTSLAREGRLVTHDRVVTESSALVQRRLGMPAARVLHRELLPPVRIVDLSQRITDRATERWLAADRRQLSLVDVTSFVVMEELGITLALALDDDFAQQGFEVAPAG